MRGDGHVDAPRQVYDSAAVDYVEFVGTELGDATEDVVDRSMLSAFADLVATAGGGRVADLGCGPGRVAASLARAQLDVVGIDVSLELLRIARAAHPNILFEVGRLDGLPFADSVLAGAVSWYSIIYTPPDLLDGALSEMARVIASDGLLLVAFQAGGGDPVVRSDAFGTGVSLTSYRHDVEGVARRLEAAGFDAHASTLRAARLEHEATSQAFIIARRR